MTRPDKPNSRGLPTDPKEARNRWSNYRVMRGEERLSQLIAREDDRALPSITQEEEIGAAEPLSPPICLQLAKVDHFPVYLYWQLIVGLLKETRQQHRRPAYSRFSVREALIPWDVNRLQWLRIQYCWQGLLLRIEQRIGRSGEVKWPLDVGMGTKALKTVVQCLESVRPKSGSAGDVKLSFLCLCGDDSAVCYHHGVHHGKDNDSCEHVASIGSLDTLRKECHDSVDCDSPRCRNKPAFVCPDALKFWLGRSQVSLDKHMLCSPGIATAMQLSTGCKLSPDLNVSSIHVSI